MAQLRQDFHEFAQRDVVILVLGPEDAHNFKEYFIGNDLPFAGLPDPEHKVLKKYGQEIKLFKFGRMPAQIVIDKEGIARYVHYGNSMIDIPGNRDLLAIIDQLQEKVVSEAETA